MNRFEVARNRLNSVMMNYAMINIVYHRGDTGSTIRCWAGRTVFPVTQEKNERLEFGDRDYLIPISEFKINGVLSEPQENDWIEETFTNPTRVKQFRLAAPDNEPVWRYSDIQKTCYRIHTKEETIV